MSKEKSDQAEREIRVSRLINAPASLLWEVWTNPDHIKNWWGPNGFTNTITKMEIEPDGEWDLVMHGPDGTDYDNKSKFLEVIKEKKIVYRHLTDPKFTSTIEFESRGNKTFLSWHMLFGSREQLIEVVKKFHADEGLRQNLDKLENYLKLNFN